MPAPVGVHGGPTLSPLRLQVAAQRFLRPEWPSAVPLDDDDETESNVTEVVGEREESHGLFGLC